MRIAILSDSHDHMPNLSRAVQLANREGAEVLLHCGDLISPFMLKYLNRFHGPVHLIYGNNTGDQHLIASRCATVYDNLHHHGQHASFHIGTYRVALNHYPELARPLAQSGQYDLVCCGHNHIHAEERFGQSLLINPGDLLGKDAVPGFILLDTGSGKIERLQAGEQLIMDE